MGRSKICLTEKEKSEIQRLSGLGLSIQKIAASIGFSKATLDRRISEDDELKILLENGRGKAIEQISSKAFEMALSGKHPSVTMFWLKSMAGWSDKEPQPVSSREPTTIQLCYRNETRTLDSIMLDRQDEDL